MATYDFMETVRNTNEWLGASARSFARYPVFSLSLNPLLPLVGAWGEVAERSFSRMVVKPDWGISTIVGPDDQDLVVGEEIIVAKPFGNLVKFDVHGRPPMARRILIVAPLSGHHATLLRSTVMSLLPDADVFVTDWHNARDIPVSAGRFDVEDYTLYVAEFLQALGPDLHVMAVCQPVPLVLAATAHIAARDPAAEPRSLILLGGPVDPDAAPSDVTDFGRRVTMGQLEQFAIQTVGFGYRGAGRRVFPGMAQLAGFLSMNPRRHASSFATQIVKVALGAARDQDKHNRFYDEYLAVMDMTAEFYLSTVERIFKKREIALNTFTLRGEPVDLTLIRRAAVMVVEGEKDDISAPGQCLAALDLLSGLPAARKMSHLEPDAGHYGIFAGHSWRQNIRPLVLDFIDNAMETARPQSAPPRQAGETVIRLATGRAG